MKIKPSVYWHIISISALKTDACSSYSAQPLCYLGPGAAAQPLRCRPAPSICPCVDVAGSAPSQPPSAGSQKPVLGSGGQSPVKAGRAPPPCSPCWRMLRGLWGGGSVGDAWGDPQSHWCEQSRLLLNVSVRMSGCLLGALAGVGKVLLCFPLAINKAQRLDLILRR